MRFDYVTEFVTPQEADNILSWASTTSRPDLKIKRPNLYPIIDLDYDSAIEKLHVTLDLMARWGGFNYTTIDNVLEVRQGALTYIYPSARLIRTYFQPPLMEFSRYQPRKVRNRPKSEYNWTTLLSTPIK